MNVDEAYARCEVITAAEARNFSYGIRLLRPPERKAMSALYALARRIDDVGDGTAEPAVKLESLAQIRKDVAAASGGRPGGDDPVMMALADVCLRWPLPVTAIDELIEGCELDALGTRYPTFDELVGYCRRVAGTVGRLSLAIYGCPPTEKVGASSMADDLGVALQVTNILRDIVEDKSQMGRVYLPTEDAARFGLDAELDGPTDGLLGLILFEAARAEEYYERGLRLLPLLDRRSRACTAAMAGIYRRLLDRIQADPAAVLSGRLSLPTRTKAAVAARALTIGRA